MIQVYNYKSIQKKSAVTMNLFCGANLLLVIGSCACLIFAILSTAQIEFMDIFVIALWFFCFCGNAYQYFKGKTFFSLIQKRDDLRRESFSHNVAITC